MLTYILLAIVITALCLIHDWQHDKSSVLEALKAYWLKYILVFIVVAFAAGYILEWKYFRYALAAGAGVTLYLFYGVVYGWFTSLFKKKV